MKYVLRVGKNGAYMKRKIAWGKVKHSLFSNLFHSKINLMFSLPRSYPRKSLDKKGSNQPKPSQSIFIIFALHTPIIEF
jgi:hypothetical protein